MFTLSYLASCLLSLLSLHPAQSLSASCHVPHLSSTLSWQSTYLQAVSLYLYLYHYLFTSLALASWWSPLVPSYCLFCLSLPAVMSPHLSSTLSWQSTYLHHLPGQAVSYPPIIRHIPQSKSRIPPFSYPYLILGGNSLIPTTHQLLRFEVKLVKSKINFANNVNVNI